jgi:hypothetical protein
MTTASAAPADHLAELRLALTELERHETVLHSWAWQLADVFRNGGRLLAAGNGGSAARGLLVWALTDPLPNPSAIGSTARSGRQPDLDRHRLGLGREGGTSGGRPHVTDAEEDPT